MPTTPAGVYPVWSNAFSVDTTGGDGSTAANLKAIAEMESFSVAIDGNVEEWTSMDAEGWGKAFVTGKKITLSVKGKRCVGDDGNDYISGLALSTGSGCRTTFKVTFYSGASILIPCIINVTAWEGADSTNLAPLEFDVQSYGKPTFTAAA